MVCSADPASRTVVSEEEHSITVSEGKNAGIDLAEELVAAVDNYCIIGKRS